MRNTYVLFSYERDSAAAVLISKRLMGSKHTASVTVVGDANRPCTPEAVEELKAMGVHYYDSSWPRKGNLNGKDCVLGIIECMASACARDGGDTDFTIKVDCDNLITDKYLAALDQLDEIYVGYGHTYDKCHPQGYPSWFGAAYSIRSSLMPKLLPRAVKIFADDENEVLLEYTPKFPEDQTIAKIVSTFGFVHRRKSILGPRGNLFVGFPYSTGKLYEWTDRTVESVNFGWFGYENVSALSAVDQKKAMVDAMTKWDAEHPLS